MSEPTPRNTALRKCAAANPKHLVEIMLAKHHQLEIELLAVSSELDDIRAVFSHGANEELWPPGMTLAQAVQKLVESLEKIARPDWAFDESAKIESHPLLKKSEKHE